MPCRHTSTEKYTNEYIYARCQSSVGLPSMVVMLHVCDGARFGTNTTRTRMSHEAIWPYKNKANLRDLIAATGLVISNWIKIVNFSARVTVKFDGWPCKTIGHLFYATSSFVRHFVAIGEFKLEIQSGNAQFGSNLTIFRAVRPWNLTNDLEKQ